ncbi:hypothetical protein QE152_g8916 [Popillia japonica]|uniref:Uncharacterized protein n=1 Tax=Popillia japonica TaxID=7064 RepID=A0AAW1M203_POPJA
MQSSPEVMSFLSLAILERTSASVIRPTPNEGYQPNNNGGEVVLVRYAREKCKANPLTMSPGSLNSMPFRSMCPGIRDDALLSLTNFQKVFGFITMSDSMRC